jgi:predicted RNA-binding Zn-ribbon protein involved in translation (DUF1610 family)
MPRVYLPPGCLGFRASDGKRILARNGPGSFANVDDQYMPALRNQEYAAAGLVDANAEKFFTVKGPDGRWCASCAFLAHAWSLSCPKCGGDTVPESQMSRPKLGGQYIP